MQLLSTIWEWVRALISSEHVAMGAQGLVVLVLGLLIAKAAAAAVERVMTGRTTPQYAMIVRRSVLYGIVGLVVVSALRTMGFDLSVLVGAAGILTVAVGFASQTSASNLISGVFLMGEQPFVIGDVIKVGMTTGEVTSIDLLSVKLRTFDNLLVRIPNESLFKSELTNLTHFPIRRVDISIALGYKEDIRVVRELLFEVADKNPLSLGSPEPSFLFLGFAESSMTIQFSVWAAREQFAALKNSIHEEIKRAFEAEGIEFPFPHRTLIVEGAPESASTAP